MQKEWQRDILTTILINLYKQTKAVVHQNLYKICRKYLKHNLPILKGHL